MLLEGMRRRIVEAIAAAPGRALGVQQLAELLGVTHPGISRHLLLLEQAGAVRRSESSGRNAPYTLGDYVGIEWVDGERGIVKSWTNGGPVNWRHPLVSRVPDAAAQRTLVAFLGQVEAEGLFAPWLVKHLLRDLKGMSPDKSILPRPDPADDYQLTFIVYGSCARGEANPKSDLDLLVMVPRDEDQVPPRIPYDLQLGNIASQANLWAERPIQLKVIQADEFDLIPGGLREAIRKDGITVYSTFSRQPGRITLSEGSYIEAHRAMQGGGS